MDLMNQPLDMLNLSTDILTENDLIDTVTSETNKIPTSYAVFNALSKINTITDKLEDDITSLSDSVNGIRPGISTINDKISAVGKISLISDISTSLSTVQYSIKNEIRPEIDSKIKDVNSKITLLSNYLMTTKKSLQTDDHFISSNLDFVSAKLSKAQREIDEVEVNIFNMGRHLHDDDMYISSQLSNIGYAVISNDTLSTIVRPLVITELTKEQYYKIPFNGLLSNGIYLIEQDYLDAIGKPIRNVADPEQGSDAMNLHSAQVLVYSSVSSFLKELDETQKSFYNIISQISSFSAGLKNDLNFISGNVECNIQNILILKDYLSDVAVQYGVLSSRQDFLSTEVDLIPERIEAVQKELDETLKIIYNIVNTVNDFNSRTASSESYISAQTYSNTANISALRDYISSVASNNWNLSVQYRYLSANVSKIPAKISALQDELDETQRIYYNTINTVNDFAADILKDLYNLSVYVLQNSRNFDDFKSYLSSVSYQCKLLELKVADLQSKMRVLPNKIIKLQAELDLTLTNLYNTLKNVYAKINAIQLSGVSGSGVAISSMIGTNVTKSMTIGQYVNVLSSVVTSLGGNQSQDDIDWFINN